MYKRATALLLQLMLELRLLLLELALSGGRLARTEPLDRLNQWFLADEVGALLDEDEAAVPIR